MPTDPQGYPLVAYERISDGQVMFQVLSDGTIVLNTGVEISSGSGSPNGVVTAPVGSLYTDKNGVTPNILYQKQTGSGNTGWVAIGGGGGGGTPGGANTDVQFNNSGVFAGDDNFQWDTVNKLLHISSASGGTIEIGPAESVLPAPIRGWTGAPNLIVSNNLLASVAGGAFGVEAHYSNANGGNSGAISAVTYGDQTIDGPGSLAGIGVNGANFWGLINTSTHIHGNVYGVIAGAGMAAGTGNPDILAAYIAWPLFVGGSGVPIVACDYYSRGPSPDGSSVSAGFYAPDVGGHVSTYATFRSDLSGAHGGFAFLASDATTMSKFGKVAGGANMRGTVTSGGGTTVSVTYANAYASTPVVVVTPTSNCGTFFISAQSASGFTITYQTSGVQSFNWIAIA